MADWEKYLTSEDQSHIGSVTTACGITPKATLDPALVTPFMEANAHAAAYCDSTYEALANICKDAIGKEMVAKSVKAISCKLGKDAEPTIKLTDGTLEVAYSTGTSNLTDKIKEWLENNLK